jgi:hypothetical protein
VILMSVAALSEELEPKKTIRVQPPLPINRVDPNVFAPDYDNFLKSTMENEQRVADLLVGVHDNASAQKALADVTKIAVAQAREADFAAHRRKPDAVERGRIEKNYQGRTCGSLFRKNTELHRIKKLANVDPAIVAEFERLASPK